MAFVIPVGDEVASPELFQDAYDRRREREWFETERMRWQTATAQLQAIQEQVKLKRELGAVQQALPTAPEDWELYDATKTATGAWSYKMRPKKDTDNTKVVSTAGGVVLVNTKTNTADFKRSPWAAEDAAPKVVDRYVNAANKRVLVYSDGREQVLGDVRTAPVADPMQQFAGQVLESTAGLYLNGANPSAIQRGLSMYRAAKGGAQVASPVGGQTRVRIDTAAGQAGGAFEDPLLTVLAGGTLPLGTNAMPVSASAPVAAPSGPSGPTVFTPQADGTVNIGAGNTNQWIEVAPGVRVRRAQ